MCRTLSVTECSVCLCQGFGYFNLDECHCHKRCCCGWRVLLHDFPSSWSRVRWSSRHSFLSGNYCFSIVVCCRSCGNLPGVYAVDFCSAEVNCDKKKNQKCCLLSPPSVNVVNIGGDYEIGRSVCPLFSVCTR